MEPRTTRPPGWADLVAQLATALFGLMAVSLVVFGAVVYLTVGNERTHPAVGPYADVAAGLMAPHAVGADQAPASPDVASMLIADGWALATHIDADGHCHAHLMLPGEPPETVDVPVSTPCTASDVATHLGLDTVTA